MSGGARESADAAASAERLLRREALRREAAGIAASSSPTALERTLAAVSAEVTEEASDRRARELASARPAANG